MFLDKHIEVGELAVVPVEFQSLVSFELFSFANGSGLVKFILAYAKSRLFRVSQVFKISVTYK